MILVGERLNSSRKAVFEAFQRKDKEFFVEEARRQEEAGAGYIDINAAALLDEEIPSLEWAIPLLQSNLRVPLSLDTPNPEALEKGLKIHQGRALLNSLTGEKKKIQKLLPLIQEYHPCVIVLCLDEEGVPQNPEKAFSIAERTVNFLFNAGLAKDDIFVDPLVRPVGVDWRSTRLFLDSLVLIKRNLPEVHLIAGISNVSFGLPQRKLLNRTLLVLALHAGLDAAICDPLDKDLLASLYASEALLGKDPSLKNYLRFHRGKLAN